MRCCLLRPQGEGRREEGVGSRKLGVGSREEGGGSKGVVAPSCRLDVSCARARRFKRSRRIQTGLPSAAHRDPLFLSVAPSNYAARVTSSSSDPAEGPLSKAPILYQLQRCRGRMNATPDLPRGAVFAHSD
ncbi:hypothetical protein EYF80_032252 [Liparis tanakae]|uniref:Uncharacterized protein n=1 Tax=Liparis tanakae TaxID=230148 RepID=A0A4Z2GVE1_9TELE|nr:hypothetical protein EYF80_032252 [Liparis tanakae]